jgi:hypothetical protein
VVEQGLFGLVRRKIADCGRLPADTMSPQCQAVAFSFSLARSTNAFVFKQKRKIFLVCPTRVILPELSPAAGAIRGTDRTDKTEKMNRTAMTDKRCPFKIVFG